MLILAELNYLGRQYREVFQFDLIYYLLIELTIVQVLAAVFFMALLMLGGMVSFAKPFIDDAEKIYRGRHILRKYWLYTLIWVVLLLWGLKEILQ